MGRQLVPTVLEKLSWWFVVGLSVAVVHCTRRNIVLTGDSELLNQFIYALTQ